MGAPVPVGTLERERELDRRRTMHLCNGHDRRRVVQRIVQAQVGDPRPREGVRDVRRDLRAAGERADVPGEDEQVAQPAVRQKEPLSVFK